MANIIARAAVNNAILDPLSGFDIDVFVQDQVTGKQMLAGSFTSFQFTVRNATEPYMEFNQRIPRLLDGEFQFGWVLERGCIDSRFIEQTFGIDSMSREMRLNRSPRFQITVEINAPELDGNKSSETGSGYDLSKSSSGDIRKAKGRYRLIYAKTDAITFGAMAGRSVVANRWEGLCEGIMYKDGTTGWAGVSLNSKDVDNTSVAQFPTRDIYNGIVNDFTTELNTRPDWVTANYDFGSGGSGSAPAPAVAVEGNDGNDNPDA